MFVGVPRVWEKIKDHIDSVARETHGIKETILTKARVRGDPASVGGAK